MSTSGPAAVRRRLLPLGVVGTAAFGACLVAAVAFAVAAFAWTGVGAGDGGSSSAALRTPDAPVATLVGADIVVTWPALGGRATPDYVVRRYDPFGEPAAVSAACDEPISVLRCQEDGVPAGSWVYTVTAVQGSWVGGASAPSEVVVVS